MHAHVSEVDPYGIQFVSEVHYRSHTSETVYIFASFISILFSFKSQKTTQNKILFIVYLTIQTIPLSSKGMPNWPLKSSLRQNSLIDST